MYTYDRRSKTATDPEDILPLIIKGILRNRNVENLVSAYIDAALENYLEQHNDDDTPPGDSTARYEAWMKQKLGILYGDNEVEAALLDSYVQTYRDLVPRVSVAQAREVFLYPRGLPSSKPTPRSVAQAVGRELAVQDADNTNAMRELARSRQR
jgi:hypothetical protein